MRFCVHLIFIYIKNHKIIDDYQIKDLYLCHVIYLLNFIYQL